MAQIKVSEQLRDDLQNLKDKEGHMTYNGAIQHLLTHYENHNEN